MIVILLENLIIKNYRNVRHAKLGGLKGLNILIGPNNCGKTNILEFIFSLSKLYCSDTIFYCPDCIKFQNTTDGIKNVILGLSSGDFPLKKPKKKRMEVEISLNREEINRLVPKALNKQKELAKNIACKHSKETIHMKSTEYSLRGVHFSPFIHRDIIEELKNSLFYCPERRLKDYKNKKFKKFIRDKNFSGAGSRRLIEHISNLVDPAIHDYKYEDLIRKVGNEDLVTPIKEQGSGVRSVICLIADILSEEHAKILLIDEPELGLNQASKQALLKLLLDLSGEKQIFIATHDETFVNPVLFSENVSVYLYSPWKDAFLNVDMNQSKQDPETFAGYLPHTTSLKKVHLYVEGGSDVYIFQIFLRKHLKENHEEWMEILNQIGIFHLGGDLYPHLFYTIPRKPYKAVVVLDGDKRENIQDVCEKYKKRTVKTSKFKFFEIIDEIKKYRGEKCPIYCLKKKCIEEYLVPKPKYEDEHYDKKKDGAKIAEKMTLSDIHEELKEILTLLTSSTKQVLRRKL